ncbi:MAG: hypothetical protein ACU841_11985 [Gammaproteobacteria bacterium]
MYLKIVAVFIAILAIPSTALSWVNKNEVQQQLRVPAMDAAVYSKKPPVGAFERKADKKQSATRTTADKQSQLFIELCVYIIIIMVYSIYWLKVSRPH